ncbi:MAG: CPBP family intramembrane metalloprotease [Bacteroidaceae bacterium]|nr:CPBP family intramembrane metalloprotease [Bacteroidaceae bacterium]
MKKTLTTIGIWIGSQITVTIIFMIAAMIMKMDINSILAPSLLVSDFLVIVLLLIIRYCGFKELFKGVPFDVFLISIVFAICGMMAVDLLSTTVEIPNILEQQFEEMSKSIWGFLGICIIGPIMEEIMMRRVILKEMEKLTKSMWWGIIISAALFAVIHINPIQVVFAMPAGIILGWLYCKTGSLLVPICVHILNNSIAFITMKMGSEKEINLNDTLGVILLIVFLVLSTAAAIWIVIYYSKKSKEEAESMAQDMTQLETAPIVEEQTNPEVTENGDNYQI